MATSTADAAAKPQLPLLAPDSIMSPKAHGTCTSAPQARLRWGCDLKTADHICCFNRPAYAPISRCRRPAAVLDARRPSPRPLRSRDTDPLCFARRHYAEYAGYMSTTVWAKEMGQLGDSPSTYYDSCTVRQRWAHRGKELVVAGGTRPAVACASPGGGREEMRGRESN